MSRALLVRRMRHTKNRRVGRETAIGHAAARLWRTVRLVGSVCLAVTAVVVVSVGIWQGWQAVRQSSRLQVHRIEIRGHQRATRAEVEAYAGVQVGDPIVDLDLDAVALNLRRDPWVKSARVQRRLPDGLGIEITEHEPAIVVSLGELYLADAEGEIFKRLSPTDGIVLPVVTGLDRDLVARDPALAALRVREAVSLAQALADDTRLIDEVEELHWDADLGWGTIARLATAGSPACRLHLGTRPLEHLETARAALARLRELDQTPEVVWAEGDKNPQRAQVRLRQTAGATNASTLIARAR